MTADDGEIVPTCIAIDTSKLVEAQTIKTLGIQMGLGVKVNSVCQRKYHLTVGVLDKTPWSKRGISPSSRYARRAGLLQITFRQWHASIASTFSSRYYLRGAPCYSQLECLEPGCAFIRERS